MSNFSKNRSKRIANRFAPERTQRATTSFPFPERIAATPEIVEFAAKHGYVGNDLRDCIELMRLKRLRDRIEYTNTKELALDIQYWIATCAQNRNRRREAVNE